MGEVTERKSVEPQRGMRLRHAPDARVTTIPRPRESRTPFLTPHATAAASLGSL